MADLIEPRCAKPGCGALRRVGNPCYDWDCPQHTVSVEDYQSLRAALAKSEEARETAERTLSDLRDDVEVNRRVFTRNVRLTNARAETAEASLSQALARIEEREKALKPVVKPLEWDIRNGDWCARPESGPSYHIAPFHGAWDLLIDGHFVKPYRHGVRETYALDEAKAAAEADYRRRILSALPATPIDGGKG